MTQPNSKQAPSRLKNLAVRLVTAAIAGTLFFAPSLYCPLMFKLLITALIGLGLHEFDQMTLAVLQDVFKDYPHHTIAHVFFVLSGLSIPISCFSGSYTIFYAFTLGALCSCFVFHLGVAFKAYRQRIPQGSLFHMSLNLLGIMWISLSISHGFFIVDRGQGLVAILLAACWSADGAAYFVGSTLGKHKIFPALSPNKSWEGTLGGIFFGTLVPAAIMIPLRRVMTALPGLSLTHYLTISFFVAVLSQFGDLVESFIKRASGVKDSGWIFPGHGGVLDRIDGLFFSGPFVCLYMRFLL